MRFIDKYDYAQILVFSNDLHVKNLDVPSSRLPFGVLSTSWKLSEGYQEQKPVKFQSCQPWGLLQTGRSRHEPGAFISYTPHTIWLTLYTYLLSTNFIRLTNDEIVDYLSNTYSCDIVILVLLNVCLKTQGSLTTTEKPREPATSQTKLLRCV